MGLAHCSLLACRHTISLYASITGIKWDYNNHNIAGCESLRVLLALLRRIVLCSADIMPEGGAVKSFSIKKGAVSDFELANTLWDMIGEAHGLHA